MMNAHFSRRAEPADHGNRHRRIAWDHELFTSVPEIVDGHLVMPETPAGASSRTRRDPRHPAKGPTGRLSYGRKG